MHKIYFAIIGFALSTSGCAMIESDPVHFDHPIQPAAAAGSYSLPKSFLHLHVTGGTGKAISTSIVSGPDPHAQFQVGFELSPLSDDNIQVDYSPEGYLLQITAKAVDHTGDVIVAIAQDIGAFRKETVSTSAAGDFDFDPFDPLSAASTNRRLRAITGRDSCVEVELSFGTWSPGCSSRLSMNGEQNNRLPTLQDTTTLHPAPTQPGIYYRRPVLHSVHVVLGGTTSELKQYPFANESPILRIDIDRTAFVTRETTVKFQNGELASVSVNKASEALAIAKLPVQIVDAYLGGVVNAITQRTNVQKAYADNLTAQANSIATETSLKKAVAENGLVAPSSIDALSSTRNGIAPMTDIVLTPQQIRDCRNWGIAGNDDACRRALTTGGVQ